MANDSSSPVLVAVASRHGATREIADAIGAALAKAGLTAEVRDLDEIAEPSGFRAVLLGSAIYMGRWVKEARSFAEDHKSVLSSVPLWLFSSGPLDNEPPAPDNPFGIDDLAKSLNARGHHVFPGKLDKDELGFGEKAVIRMVGADEGDYRDWQDIDAWATAVAAEINGRG